MELNFETTQNEKSRHHGVKYFIFITFLRIWRWIDDRQKKLIVFYIKKAVYRSKRNNAISFIIPHVEGSHLSGELGK